MQVCLTKIPYKCKTHLNRGKKLELLPILADFCEIFMKNVRQKKATLFKNLKFQKSKNVVPFLFHLGTSLRFRNFEIFIFDDL